MASAQAGAIDLFTAKLGRRLPNRYPLFRVNRPRTCLGAEKGADARRRPKAGREAYSLYVERPDEGVNEADAPLSGPRQRAVGGFGLGG